MRRVLRRLGVRDASKKAGGRKECMLGRGDFLERGGLFGWVWGAVLIEVCLFSGTCDRWEQVRMLGGGAACVRA